MPLENAPRRAVYDDPKRGLRIFYEDGGTIECSGLLPGPLSHFGPGREGWPDLGPAFCPNGYRGDISALPQWARESNPRLITAGPGEGCRAIWDDPASEVRYYFRDGLLVASVHSQAPYIPEGWDDIEPSAWIEGRVIGDMNAIPKRMHARIAERTSAGIPWTTPKVRDEGAVQYTYEGNPVDAVRYDGGDSLYAVYDDPVRRERLFYRDGRVIHRQAERYVDSVPPLPWPNLGQAFRPRYFLGDYGAITRDFRDCKPEELPKLGETLASLKAKLDTIGQELQRLIDEGAGK